MLADMFGCLLRLYATTGQARDITSASDFLESHWADAVIGDTAPDSHDLGAQFEAMKAKAVILSKRNRNVCIPRTIDIYKHHNRIERCFNHFRRFGTR